MNRRQFGAAMAVVGLSAAAKSRASVQAEAMHLSRNGWMPNNERLPVLVYHRAFGTSADTADQMEASFKRNRWPPQWRNGVYRYHHYHSTAHEVLGIAAGSARLMLGGEGGHEAAVEAGDVLVLPAGTGHCLLDADNRFLVIGAYPVDQHWDICRTAPDRTALERMRDLPFPPSDPVGGAEGELIRAWPSHGSST